MSRAAACFRAEAALPGRVFAEPYGAFKFLEYVEMSDAMYWSLLGRLAAWSGDDRVAVISFRPDYVADFAGRGGAFEIPLTASAEAYYSELDRPLFSGYADSLRISLALAWIGRSQRWAIWGENQLSTLVVGFREGPKPSFEEMAQASGLRTWGMEEILDLVKLDFGNYDSRIGGPAKPEAVRAWEEYAAEFRRNYSPDIRPGGAKQS